MNTKNKFFDSIEIVRHKELFDSSDMVVCVPTLGRTSLPDCIDSISEAFPKIPIVVSYDEPKEVSTLGNNRNKLILFCKGKKLIFNDDDVFPSEMGIGKIDGQFLFFSNKKELEDSINKIKIDLIDYYNKLFEIPNFIIASGGVYGNYIGDNPFLFIVRNLSRGRINTLTKEDYEVLKTGKFYMVQNFYGSNSSFYKLFVGAHFLLDTRKVPIIPFYPFFRGQDRLFLTMNNLLYQDYSIYYMPYMFYHNSSEKRNYTNRIFDIKINFCIILNSFLNFRTIGELLKNLEYYYNNFHNIVLDIYKIRAINMSEHTIHNFMKINKTIPPYIEEDIQKYLKNIQNAEEKIKRNEKVDIFFDDLSYEETRETIIYYIQYIKEWFKAWENL